MSQTFRIVNGDWVITPAGQPDLISNLPKLGQDFTELLTINTMPNGFGASLEEVVGTVGVPTTIAASLDSRIRSAIQRWQVLQQKQRAVRTLQERVASLALLTVRPPMEKVNYSFSVAINSEDPRVGVTRSGSV